MDISISTNGYSVRPPERADSRVSAANARQAQAAADAADSVAFSEEGLKIARWIETAKSEPAVRSEKVAEFQQKVRSGNYPPPELAEGLARLIGTGILATAKS